MKELIEIQRKLKAPKSQRNNFGKYNYRSCEDILEAVKPLLHENGVILAITDEIKECGGTIYVEATATLIKGEQVITVKAQAGIDVNRKGMDISQSFGSSSSYARKYALNGLFLIDDTKDADTREPEKPNKKFQTITAPHGNKQCKYCGSQINKGDEIIVNPETKDGYHIVCFYEMNKADQEADEASMPEKGGK